MPDAKIAVYTCILPHDYVQLQAPLYVNKNTDQVHYWCATNEAQYISPWWDLLVGPYKTISSLREIQRHRLQSHELWPEYDYTIWVDGEVRLKVDPVQLVGMLQESGCGIGFIAHPQRDCLYDEAKVYLSFGAVDLDTISAQLDRYRTAGFPKHNGLATVNFFIRDNKDPDIIRLMERWHKETQNGCCRTQMSFPYAAWVENVPYWLIPWEVLSPGDPSEKMRIWQDNTIYRRKGFVYTSTPLQAKNFLYCDVIDIPEEVIPVEVEAEVEVEEPVEEVMLHINGILDSSDRVFLRLTAARAQAEFGVPTIVNIGVLKGASCYCLRVGAPNAILVGVDPKGWPEVEGTAEMKTALNMRFLEGRSQDVFSEFDEPIHLIFIDGDHAYTAVRNDILNWVLPHVVVGGVALFHDAIFKEDDPFHHVGVRISKAIDEHMGDDWEEQELMFQTRWFVRKR